MIKYKKYLDGSLYLLTENIFNEAEMNWFTEEFNKDDFELPHKNNDSWSTLNRKYKTIKLPCLPEFDNNFIDRINNELNVSFGPSFDLWIDEVRPNTSTHMSWHTDVTEIVTAGQIYFPMYTNNENEIGRGTRFIADDVIVCPQYLTGMGYIMSGSLPHSPTDMSVYNSNRFTHRRSIYLRELKATQP